MTATCPCGHGPGEHYEDTRAWNQACRACDCRRPLTRASFAAELMAAQDKSALRGSALAYCPICRDRLRAPSGDCPRHGVAPTLTSVPLSDDQARELSRASKQVTSWTERRNTLIRDALATGAGVREVARACGLNHATVININKPRGQR